MSPTTEEIEITRPQRRRIIPRTSSFVKAKAPVRLVRRTRSQSSRLIRRRRPSAVTPALLTRMSISANSAGRPFKTPPIASGWATSRARGWAAPPAAAMAAAPSASFSTLRAPSPTFPPRAAGPLAPAPPAPPQAPGRAGPLRGPGHQGSFAVESEHSGLQELAQHVRIAHRGAGGAGGDPAVQAGQNRPGTHLNEGIHPETLRISHPEHRLDPAHR